MCDGDVLVWVVTGANSGIGLAITNTLLSGENKVVVVGVDKEVEELQKIEGSMNPADLCTRPLAKEHQVGPESVWQQGPAFLKHPRESWPICIPDDDGSIPEVELRPNCVAVLVVAPVPPLEA